MSYCIAFNENLFILSLVQTRSFLRGGSLNMQYTLDQLLNKISALEDPFQYFHFNRDVICNRSGLCKIGPGHFASEQSFPSKFAQ